MPTIAGQGGFGVDSVRGGLSHNGLTLCSKTSRNSFSIFIMGGKGFGVKQGSITASRHDSTRALWRLKCRGLGGITMTGRTELHTCQGNVTAWAPLQRQRHSAYFCDLLSGGQCKSPSCTCCPRLDAVLQNHDFPSKVSRPVSN